MPQTPPCIIPRCGRPASCRGLCRACYRRAFVVVSERRESWDSLRDAGLALDAGPRWRNGSPRRGPTPPDVEPTNPLPRRRP